jgi:hypothetical protein
MCVHKGCSKAIWKAVKSGSKTRGCDAEDTSRARYMYAHISVYTFRERARATEIEREREREREREARSSCYQH